MTRDARVYVVELEHFAPQVQLADEGRNCCRAEDGKDWFHRIARGEIYVSDGERDFCLNCGLAMGLLGSERPGLLGGSPGS